MDDLTPIDFLIITSIADIIRNFFFLGIAYPVSRYLEKIIPESIIKDYPSGVRTFFLQGLMWLTFFTTYIFVTKGHFVNDPIALLERISTYFDNMDWDILAFPITWFYYYDQNKKVIEIERQPIKSQLFVSIFWVVLVNILANTTNSFVQDFNPFQHLILVAVKSLVIIPIALFIVIRFWCFKKAGENMVISSEVEDEY